MPVRPVRIYGDPVLRQKAAEVTVFDEALRVLVADLRDTMKAYNGVGLAANQVGVLQRVLVVDVPVDDERRDRHTLVNPVIEQRSGSEVGEEGCGLVRGTGHGILLLLGSPLPRTGAKSTSAAVGRKPQCAIQSESSSKHAESCPGS